MKKLITLLAITVVSLTAFSQSGTKDTSNLCLPLPWAKEIAKDLLRKDSIEQENKLLWKNSEIQNNQLRLKDANIQKKDSIIVIKNALLASKDTIISLKDNQFKAQKDISNKLEKELKKQKNKSLISGISGGVIVATLVALLVLN
jgi:hypothetical protein